MIQLFHYSEKNFAEYLLPSDLVNELEVKFTSDDKFNCIGTTTSLAKKKCEKKGMCMCNKYVNAPFVTAVEVNAIVNLFELRHKPVGEAIPKSQGCQPCPSIS